MTTHLIPVKFDRQDGQRISDTELRALNFVYTAGDVPRLVAEVRRQRVALCQAEQFRTEVEALARSIEAGVERVLAKAAEADRLRSLIETYATSPMPFEAFIELALGEEKAAEIFEAQDRAHAQSATQKKE